MNLLEKLNNYSLTNPEVKPLVYDILRTVTVQIVTQLLISSNSSSIAFLSETFIQTTLFLCIGVVAFWLVVYKLLIQTPLKLDI
tara:strand:- start:1345 stop:1596 length:252 start_codon:yes stop_codon:yes gene_type:complete